MHDKLIFNRQSTIPMKQVKILVATKLFLFDFEVVYTKIPEPDSDGGEDYKSNGVEIRTINQLQRYGRDLFTGQDEEQINSYNLRNSLPNWCSSISRGVNIC